MLRLVSSLLKQPVMAAHLPQPLGFVRDYILDPDKGQLVAYAVKSGRHTTYVSTVDVVKHFDDAVQVSNAEALQDLDELVRIKHLIHAPIKLIGAKVVDENGASLGKVKDALFDTLDHRIARLHIKPTLVEQLFTEERIIPRDRIVRIEPRHVVIRNVEKTLAAEPQVEAAP